MTRDIKLPVIMYPGRLGKIHRSSLASVTAEALLELVGDGVRGSGGLLVLGGGLAGRNKGDQPKAEKMTH